MMRRLSIFLAAVLMACTVPPNTPIAEAVPTESKPVEPAPVNPRPASKPAPKVPAIAEVPAPKEQCANIKTGDVKEDIHLKLDCLLSPQK